MTAPSGTATARDAEAPRRGRALAALRQRDFAVFWTGALLSNTGTFMQVVAVPYALYQITESAAWVGAASFMQLFPAVLLGPLAGSLADRFPRRQVLLVTQSLLAVLALALWGLWGAGVRSPWAIVGVIGLMGVVMGINIPSWQAFVADLVPRHLLLNAVTLNSAQFNGARAVGPALGGVVIAAFGVGTAFLVNAVSFVAVIVALLAVRTRPPRPERQPGGVRQQFLAALRYTRGQPALVTAVLVVSAVSLLAFPVLALGAVLASDVFGVGAAGFGVMNAAFGGGALVGAWLVGTWGGSLSRGALAGLSLAVLGASLAGVGASPWFALAVVLLGCAGAGFLGLVSTLNTTVQLIVPDAMRGRVMALYVMGFTGAAPIGSLLQGWIADLVGIRATVVAAGTILLVVMAWTWLRGRLARLDADSGEAEGGLPPVPGPAGPSARGVAAGAFDVSDEVDREQPRVEAAPDRD